MLNLRCAVVVLFLMACNDGAAQIQQAWVARYNNGIATGTNQAVKMTLDSAGNIYVAGFSQNTNGNLGYVTIKYAPNGNQVWVARYDSTNYPNAETATLVLDVSNNVIVTGSAVTVKYDTNGSQLWAAPYGGTTLAVDNGCNSYVGGFSQNFGTVKLSPQGSSIWLTSYIESYGPTISQSVLVDGGNNVYVSGLDSYYSFYNNGMLYGPYVELTTIKYDSSGTQLWKESQAPQPEFNGLQVEGAALDGSTNLYLVSRWLIPGEVMNGYETYKYTSSGSLVWNVSPDSSFGQANGLVLDSSGNALLVGQDPYSFNGAGNYNFYSVIFKLNSSGSTVWENHFPESPFGSSAYISVAVDSASNSYITGYSPGTNGSNDIVTIKYSPNGNQVWLHRYTSTGNGNAAGNAIAVDNNGNVYVAGYDTTTAGGTEMVLIKYSPITLQRKPDGTVLLETQGFPGESFDIEASIDLLNWLDLGTVLADTNGLMQFDDTNAPNFPSRFYYTNPQ
jgi:hypothetical protein